MTSPKIKVDDLPFFDAVEYLRSEKDIAAFLKAGLGEGDPPEVKTAFLETAARARAKIAMAEQ
jgi:DNA-binding phage protein